MKFTYSEYEKLICFLLENGYVMAGYDDYNQIKQAAILRHDIDMSLEKAVQMAKIENYIGGGKIKSTYFVLISSDFYNVFSKHSLDCIKEIKKFGHAIGLHFDEKKYFFAENIWKKDLMIEKILYEKKILEEMIDVNVNCVSMHMPSKMTLKADLKIPGMINSYSHKFFEEFKYVSDSYHRWREDIWSIIKNEAPQRLHVLTHAFWYNNKAMTRNESIMEYIGEGEKYRCWLVEKNVLPPGVNLEESLADESGNIRE